MTLLERLFHLGVRVGWIVDRGGPDAEFPHISRNEASLQRNIELYLALTICLNLKQHSVTVVTKLGGLSLVVRFLVLLSDWLIISPCCRKMVQQTTLTIDRKTYRMALFTDTQRHHLLACFNKVSLVHTPDLLIMKQNSDLTDLLVCRCKLDISKYIRNDLPCTEPRTH